jgi:4-diphosphocytidyl-2-C-methyl-D-erythritol kinase
MTGLGSDRSRGLGPVVRVAPAKLNLTLAVVGRRPDGFHAIHSVIVPLAFGDRLSLAVRPAGDDTLHVVGLDPGPPAGNLVLRAVAAIRAALAAAGVATPGLAIRLDKRIPVAAGLGGGSSDAAAAIGGALEAWGADLDVDRRASIAATLGSDVPFFLVGGPALVEGRGERVGRLRGTTGDPVGVVVVTPPVAVPTAEVFAALAAGGPGAAPAPGPTRLTSEHVAVELRAGLRGADLVARAGVLASANDLAAAAAVVAPGLVLYRRALNRVLGKPVGLSGSGPSLWAVYPSAEAARRAADLVTQAVADGRLAWQGSGEPFVVATTIQAATPGPEPAPSNEQGRQS